MKSNDKQTIILDVDGVLIDWASQLPFYCQKNGINPVHALKHYTNPVHVDARDLFGVENTRIALEMMSRYNLEHGRYMTAFPDAVKNLHLLAKKYNLVALTKFGGTTEHYLVRKFNLQSFFPNLFKELICIDYYESKIPYVQNLVKEYDVIGFVDDQLENIIEIQRATSVPTVHLNRYDADADIKCIGDIEPFLLGDCLEASVI